MTDTTIHHAMGHRVAYFRVSAADQSIEAQSRAMGGHFAKTFKDEGVSGGIPAASRPGFGKLLEHVREGDTLCVYAVDRLGRDALDVQSTVRGLLDRGVTVEVHGLGVIGRGVGELILAVLAQVAEMERRRIAERCEAGRQAAKASLAATGKTHKGKASLGRPAAADAAAVVAWRTTNKASISQTAAHFEIGTATVKRYLAAAGEPGPIVTRRAAKAAEKLAQEEDADRVMKQLYSSRRSRPAPTVR